MSLKGAIFDLDGTLIDSEPIYFDAAQILINQYGNGKSFDWDTKIKTLGSPELVTAKIIVDTFEIKLTPEEFLKKRNAITPENFKKCPFIPGAKELTDKFKKEYKFKTAVATSSAKINFDYKIFNKREWIKEDFDRSLEMYTVLGKVDLILSFIPFKGSLTEVKVEIPVHRLLLS